MEKLKILIFLILLYLPIITSPLKLDNLLKLNENRQKASFPHFDLNQDLSKQLKSLEHYFNDNFSLRNFLVRTNSLIKYNLLKTSPTKEVTIGESGWLFYTPELTQAGSINLQPYSDNELKEIEDNLSNIYKYFKDQNISFYFVIAPNASTIYPEYLPYYLERIYTNSKLNQLTSYLEDKNLDHFYIDPTKNLTSKKNYGRLYYKYDLHWNYLGSFLVYQQLIDSIRKDFKNIPKLELDDFYITYTNSQNKGLENYIGLTGYFSDTEPKFTLKIPAAAITYSANDCLEIFNRCPKLVSYKSNTNLPKALVYRDSFASWLVPFLSQSFSQATYLWLPTPIDPKPDINTIKPQVVIFEITERNMWTLKDPLFNF